MSSEMASLPTQSDSVATQPVSPVPAVNRQLIDAYAHCREVTRQASKSFSLAARLLPPGKRRAVEALYAFARTSDDLVDEHDEPATALETWITQAHGRVPSDELLLVAWMDTCVQYGLPRTLADELLAGVAMDLSIDRYATFADLRLYCYRVASVVGLLVMHIVGHLPGADTYAVELGIALQLTNILRDVGEDAARGRIYLPQEDLERFGVAEAEILSGVRTDRFRALMRWEIARAEALYQASWPGIALLHRDGQMAVAAAALLYRAILPKIIANDYDVWNKRAFVSPREKLQALPRIWLQLAALRRGDPRLPHLRWPVGQRPLA
jgi:phytoene synthase